MLRVNDKNTRIIDALLLSLTNFISVFHFCTPFLNAKKPELFEHI